MKHSATITCPGLFYATPALDGNIYRLRTPGGITTSAQCRAIASLAEKQGDGYAQITNRANWQIRGIENNLTENIVTSLQKLELASPIPEVDHLRNLMSSPTAGIDPQQLLDPRPIVTQLDKYISTHPELAPLPPKFSIAIDGGESLSIIHHHNEILFRAIKQEGQVYFRCGFSLGKKQPPQDVGILFRVEKALEMAIALMKAYLEYQQPQKKYRLRDIIAQWGINDYLNRTSRHLNFNLSPQLPRPNSQFPTPLNLGIYPQLQPDFAYISLAIPLGKLQAEQIRQLANVAEIYGSGTLRLTPWQNLLISDIPQVKIPDLVKQLETNNWHYDHKHISNNIVACAGNKGCAASATDTQSDATKIMNYLEKQTNLGEKNIHLTGCSKSCAQQRMADITLVGKKTPQGEAYDFYVAKPGGETFGQLIHQDLPFEEIQPLLNDLLENPKKTSISPNSPLNYDY